MNLDLGESTNRYGVFIERALNHPNPSVKLMALVEIKRNIEKENILLDLSKRESLLINIVRCIADSDLSVAKKASDIVVQIGGNSFGVQHLISPSLIKAFHEIMAINEIVAMRTYEVGITGL